MIQVDAKWVFTRIKPKPSWGHKGAFGRLLMVVGSDAYRGAALLCAAGALHSGVGYPVLASSEKVCAAMTVVHPEVVLCPLPEERARRWSVLERELDLCDGVLLGNGLGQSTEALETVKQVLSFGQKPLVLDADGINLLARHKLEWNTSVSPVLTPHKGELSRLLGVSRDRLAGEAALEPALRWAKERGCVLVCKDAETVTVTPEGEVYRNTTGNVGLAKAGSGDVLAGIVASLQVQGMTPRDAAVCGVWLHGAAADIAAGRLSQHSMTPSALSRYLGEVFLTHLGR